MNSIYYWLPYFAFGLLIFGFALIGIPETLVTKTGLLAIGIILLGLILLGVQIYFCFGLVNKKVKKETGFSLLIATVIILIFLILANALLPAPEFKPVNHTQKATRLQVMRRNQVIERKFRGTDVRLGYNNLGWTDKNEDYVPDSESVVFIGDSFLEWRNSAPLSEIVEQFLKKAGGEMEVINLSNVNTDPPQYRHRFEEFALDLKPAHIFLYIYEANDLQIDYTYEPYVHSPFSVSEKAIAVLKKADIPEDILNKLRILRKEGEKYRNKAELLREFREIEITPIQKNLIYLTTFGYSPSNQGAPLIFPGFFSALRSVLGETLVGVKKNINYLRTGKKKPGGYAHRHPDYIKIFSLPKVQRLEAIAEFIAENYLFLDDYQSYLKLLKKQGDHFVSYLTDELDDTLYLMTASSQAIYIASSSRKINYGAGAIERATDEYAKLFTEMKKEANAVGITFTVVLVPEASYGDEDFRRFWMPMYDFQGFFSDKHDLYLSLEKKLSGKVPVIDLGEFPERFRDGYYKMDGHWNNKGNQKVAEIITDYILNQEKN